MANVEKKRKEAKALILFSGGLDSILAAKILAAQAVKITPICFASYFFSDEKAKQAAQENNFALRQVDISQEHLAIVKNPRRGYGVGANPCIDCHLLMLKTAKKIMEAEGYDFVATGEVMGQRPMSQNKLSLTVVEKESGLTQKLLRPLSAKLLSPTIAEIQGLIDRNNLYDISGRSRQRQLALAKKFGIKNIPQPAGGCVLADPGYGRKLKELMDKFADFTGADAQILHYGRSFWEENMLILVARNQKDCARLKQASKSGDWRFEPQNFPGPLVLIRNFGALALSEAAIKKIGERYLLKYSKKIPKNPAIGVVRNSD